MKWFMVGGVMFVLCTMFMVFQDEHNRAIRYLEKGKFDAEEVAAAAAQYVVPAEYAKGNIVFNRSEAIRAAEFILKSRLRLDTNFVPIQTYWTDRIDYDIEFFDESNTAFPYLYEHDTSYFSLLLTGPTVIVTIHFGKARYSLYDPGGALFRTAAHEWKER